MTEGAALDAVAAALEADAATRFVRFDAALFRAVLDGPARALASLAAPVRESYLRLAAEGIGHGYLVPAAQAGVQTFFTIAWMDLLPRLLPALAAERQADAIASLWNLGENLESQPAWLRKIFLRLCGGLTSLDDLEPMVARVAATAFGEPAVKLGASTVMAQWIHLGGDDPRFLPGWLHFVAPTVVCVHDRRREGNRGVWLAESPLPLGPMGCEEKSEPQATPGVGAFPPGGIVEAYARADGRVTEPHASASNAWRAAVSFETSQMILALIPAPAAAPPAPSPPA